jgi:hypothetical protein
MLDGFQIVKKTRLKSMLVLFNQRRFFIEKYFIWISLVVLTDPF